MTEYALILAAIAVVVYGVYAAMGNNIGSLTSARCDDPGQSGVARLGPRNIMSTCLFRAHRSRTRLRWPFSQWPSAPTSRDHTPQRGRSFPPVEYTTSRNVVEQSAPLAHRSGRELETWRIG